MQKTEYTLFFTDGPSQKLSPLMIDNVMAEKELVARGSTLKNNSIEFMSIVCWKVCRRIDRDNTPLDFEEFLTSVADISAEVVDVDPFPSR
ncbi:hypothetical protein FRC0474_02087 [Corynebacterium diphtheriae]|nr:hypothetical protein FRC0474_02087 [Corynebacterium diphtheriae]